MLLFSLPGVFLGIIANSGVSLTLSLVLGIAVLYYVWFRICLSNGSTASVVTKHPPSFPLGSLGYWNDLLKANKIILEDAGSKGNLVSQWLFHKEGFAVIRAEHVGAVLRSSTSRLSISPHWLQFVALYHIKNFMGANSVGVSEGKEWKDQRKAIGKSLKPKYIRSLYQDMRSCVGEVVTFFESKCEQNGGSAVIDVAPCFHDLTLDIVCMTVFREKLGALAAMREGRHEEVVEAFNFASSEMARRTSSTDPLDWLISGQKLTQAHVTIRECVEMIIRRRLKQGIKEGDDDLLRHLLPLGNNDPAGNDVTQTVVDNIITMLWAGHETTASALSFSIYELSRRQYLQDALRKELVCAKNEHGVEIPSQILMKLPILNAVIWETLRFHPPALWTNRGLVSDLDLDNPNGQTIHLKKNTGVYFPVWAVHRSEANWDRPNEYLPSRFLDEGDSIGKEEVKRTHHRFALIPFGGGKRICPGHNLSPFEIKVALADIIQKFKFAPKVEDKVLHEPSIRANGMFMVCADNQVVVTPLGL